MKLFLQTVNIPGKGKGVIATKQFHKGDYVCQYIGERLSYIVAKEREKKYLKQSVRSYKGYVFFFEYKALICTYIYIIDLHIYLQH